MALLESLRRAVRPTAGLSVCLVVGLLAAGCFHDDGAGNITTVVTTVVDTVTGDGGDSTVGDPVKPAPGKKIVADQTDAGPPRFKGCHGMSTRAILRTDEPGVILGTTDIWSHCWVGGFTGTVAVTVGDADGDALTWATTSDSWGVNGLSEAALGGGPSDRTIHWEMQVVNPSRITNAETIHIEHSWAPRNRLVEILQQAVDSGKKLAEIAALIAALTA